jgi:hypothetical protein
VANDGSVLFVKYTGGARKKMPSVLDKVQAIANRMPAGKILDKMSPQEFMDAQWINNFGEKAGIALRIGDEEAAANRAIVETFFE